MPTYSYACTACDHKFDAVQAFTDEALTSCPECTGRLRKLFNSVGVVFKGSGFYRTDSRETQKSSTPASAGGATSGAEKAAPATTTSSDSGGSAASSSGGSSSTTAAAATTS